jgi:hypothetical protein
MGNTYSKAQGIFIFYRSFLIPSLLITIFCCTFSVVLSINELKNHTIFLGIIQFFPAGFWIKAVSDLLIILYLLKFKSNELYFYFNLGIRKSQLWFFTFTIDFLVFILCFCVSSLILGLICQ